MRNVLVRFAFVLSLLVPVYFVVAALGVKYGLWGWKFGLGTLVVEWGPRLLIASFVLGVLALLAALIRRPRRGAAWALVALAIPAIGLGYLYHVRSRSQDIPPIHDVSTNPEDPPQFSARIMAARKAVDANPVYPLTTPLGAMEAYHSPRFAGQASRTVADLGRQAYPQLRTLTVETDRARLFAALAEEARHRGWTIQTNDPASGRFEATAETFWFGFNDDVAVRVRSAQAPGTLLVDARSTSRVGLSDLGTNAARLTDYLEAIAQRVRKPA